MKEIWSNPNPSSSFNPTTINVPISDVMFIEFYRNTSMKDHNTFLIEDGLDYYAICNSESNEGGNRALTKTEDGITVGDGYTFSTYPYSRKDNSFMIPYKIYTL